MDLFPSGTQSRVGVVCHSPLIGEKEAPKMKKASHEDNRTPWFLWPFVALWRLIAAIIELTGRLVAAVIGLVLMIVGVILSLTVIGAVVGIPLIIFGFLLMIRGFF
jgi:hypothetical protein